MHLSHLSTKAARSSARPVVEMHGVQVILGGQEILRGIEMHVPSGELVALIGPNGSGKTTLLRTLLGLERITAGEIKLFGGLDLPAALPRIGYVPQRFNLE